MSTQIQRKLSVSIHAFWHAGTGRGEGPGSDATVARTPAGLPYLPGRTVKGLVRAAVEQALGLGWLGDQVGDKEVVSWFGKRLVTLPTGAEDDRVRELEGAAYRFQGGEGALRFTSARIGDGASATAWEQWAQSAPEKDYLFRSFASTRVDADGIARDQTLRVIEVAVPLTLHATVEALEDNGWGNALEVALPLVRALGSSRNRGLGRATFQLEPA